MEGTIGGVRHRRARRVGGAARWPCRLAGATHFCRVLELLLPRARNAHLCRVLDFLLPAGCRGPRISRGVLLRGLGALVTSTSAATSCSGQPPEVGCASDRSHLGREV